MTLKEMDRNIALWGKYHSTYVEIQNNPRARQAMQNDPGVKFMRHGWYIIAAILFVIYIIGKVG